MNLMNSMEMIDEIIAKRKNKKQKQKSMKKDEK